METSGHISIQIILVLIVWNWPLVSRCQDELEKHKSLESFVELKGGEFFMGINDREGVNGEHPARKAIVAPFRYRKNVS